MGSNIIKFPPSKTLPISVDEIVDGLKKNNLKDIIIIGHDGNGKFYEGYSSMSVERALWLMEVAKQKLMQEIMDQDTH